MTGPDLLVVALLLLGAALYLQPAFQSFSHDGEGGCFYACWRVSAGEVPYRDILTPQMPAFLFEPLTPIVRAPGRQRIARLGRLRPGLPASVWPGQGNSARRSVRSYPNATNVLRLAHDVVDGVSVG